MTKTTTETRTREEIETQAAELAAQIEAFRQADQEKADAEHRRRLDGQKKWDEEFVANYRHTPLELDVAEARRALDEALAKEPWVVALINYQAAMRRRYQMATLRAETLARLGHEYKPVENMPTELRGLEDIVFHLAERIGSEQARDEMAELEAQRDAAGGDAP